MRVLIRIPALVVILLVGIALATAIRLRGEASASPIAAWWARRLLKLMGIRARFHGAPLRGPHVQVANHVSWLDMFVLATHGHHRYVAKSEVAGWPIVSYLANAVGTVYIRRGKGGAAPVLTQAAPLLERGEPFLFFPEGTTTDGRQLKPFHARLFGAAVAAQCPILPIAIHYRAPAGSRNVAPFIGADTLVAHILRLLANPRLDVDVVYCEPIAAGPAPEQLAARAQQRIGQALATLDDTPTRARYDRTAAEAA